MSRRGGTVALVLIGGLLLYGALWGLLLQAATLLVVILGAGLVGDLVTGNRLRANLILPAGLAGVLLALAGVAWLNLPGLVTLAGVPVVWAVLGAVLAVLAGDALVAR